MFDALRGNPRFDKLASSSLQKTSNK